jgi:hypothetical protein
VFFPKSIIAPPDTVLRRALIDFGKKNSFGNYVNELVLYRFLVK